MKIRAPIHRHEHKGPVHHHAPVETIVEKIIEKTIFVDRPIDKFIVKEVPKIQYITREVSTFNRNTFLFGVSLGAVIGFAFTKFLDILASYL